MLVNVIDYKGLSKQGLTRYCGNHFTELLLSIYVSWLINDYQKEKKGRESVCFLSNSECTYLKSVKQSGFAGTIKTKNKNSNFLAATPK